MRYQVIACTVVLGLSSALANDEPESRSLVRPFDVELMIMIGKAERAATPGSAPMFARKQIAPRVSLNVPKRVLIKAIYEQAVELRPDFRKADTARGEEIEARSDDLKSYLVEHYPDRAEEITEMFTDRYECRREDRPELAAILSGNRIRVSKAIKTIQAREDARSKDITAEIFGIVPQEDQPDFMKELVLTLRLRSLSSPLTAKSYRLTDGQRHKIRDSLEASTEFRELHGKDSPKLFAKALLPLRAEQLRKYFITIGQLKEGEELLDVVDRYPKGVQSALTEVLGHAIASSVR